MSSLEVQCYCSVVSSLVYSVICSVICLAVRLFIPARISGIQVIPFWFALILSNSLRSAQQNCVEPSTGILTANKATKYNTIMATAISAATLLQSELPSLSLTLHWCHAVIVLQLPPLLYSLHCWLLVHCLYHLHHRSLETVHFGCRQTAVG